MTEAQPGVWVYDFGQNLAGKLALRVSGLTPFRACWLPRSGP